MSLIDKAETHPIQFCFKGLKLFVSLLETGSFKPWELQFPTGETMVSVRRNQRFQCMKLLVLPYETVCLPR